MTLDESAKTAYKHTKGNQVGELSPHTLSVINTRPVSRCCRSADDHLDPRG